MKYFFSLFVISFLALTGCTTTTTTTPTTASVSSTKKSPSGPPKDMPETVLVTYHVKAGMELVFEHLLAEAWKTYRSEHLVKAEPHVLVREGEENSTIGYVEIFTWVSHAAPEHAPDSVKKIWAQEQNLCENRSGRAGIGGGEVQLMVTGH